MGVILRLLFGDTLDEFNNLVKKQVELLIDSTEYVELLENKTRKRLEDESIKPLTLYRQEELEEMKRNFFGEDQSYHAARKNFVYKVSCADKGILMNLPKQNKQLNFELPPLRFT